MRPEETLDPSDWEAVRLLGHRMIDDMIEYTRTLRERPVWQHAPEEVRAHFRESLPLASQSMEEVYEEFLENILPYPIGNNHPRFWGWVFGTGTVDGAFADFLAAIMNTNPGGLSYHSANYVEFQVIEWLKEMLKYPSEASGLITCGCSQANLIGLAVARNAKSGIELRHKGLQSVPKRMVLYSSEQIHSSVTKAVELLGLGAESLRQIPVTDEFQIDLDYLKRAIRKDREGGNLPFCVVGAAGTTNTGAVDDLEALSEICQEEDLWFHVDGAFGAWAAIVPDVSDLVSGMERADSLAFDLHKWMYLPYDIGCVLVRWEEAHRGSFSAMAAYLLHGEGERGMTGADMPWLSDYGIQLSRSFRALKAWMAIKVHGTHKFSQAIQKNIGQAQYLANLITEQEELELLNPVPLNVVNFRYTSPEADNDQLDSLNKQILIELQEQGIAAPSGTVINDKFALHVANTNHRSLQRDFDVLVEEVLRLGNALADQF
jgi:aromatic-L-amino-acid decarboxylase